MKKLSDSELQTILLDLNSRLKEQFPTYRSLHLFGSYAKGCATEESDIDVLLKFHQLASSDRFEVAGISGEIEYRYDCFIDYKIMQECKKETYNPLILEQAFGSGVSYGR